MALTCHVEAMLRHHARLSDEIVVNEGFKTGSTFEAIAPAAPLGRDGSDCLANMETVLDNPSESTRDGLTIYNWLVTQSRV